MKKLLATILVAAPLAAPIMADASVLNFNVDYSASQSLWGTSGGAGFNKSGRTSGEAGMFYTAKANSGTVSADVNGRISATYDDTVQEGQSTSVSFDFIGDAGGSNLSSTFGAGVTAGVFFPFFGDREVDLIDQGFTIEPDKDFTAEVDRRTTAYAAEEASGAKSLSIAGYSLGPSMNLDVVQNISLTPTSLVGSLFGRNLTTGEYVTRSLTIPGAGPVSTSFALSAGLWEFALMDFDLSNLFTNKIDLGFRPAVDYIFGSWPPPGEGFNFNMVNNSFALDFNTISQVGSFNIDVQGVPVSVPAPGTLGLLAASLVAMTVRRRRAGLAA